MDQFDKISNSFATGSPKKAGFPANDCTYQGEGAKSLKPSLSPWPAQSEIPLIVILRAIDRFPLGVRSGDNLLRESFTPMILAVPRLAA